MESNDKMTTETDQNTPNNLRITLQLLTLIIGDSPIHHNTMNITTDHNEVASLILEVTESKPTARLGLGIVIYNGETSTTTQRTLIKQLNYGLILDHHYDTETQKHYILQYTLYEVGNYEQRSDMYLDKSNDDHSYDISTIHNTVATQPKIYSDEEMITLSKFYTTVRNKLDLRRYPKTKVKSTGLTLLPNVGNYKKWYYGVSHDPKGEEKVTLIPYLSGDRVAVEDIKPNTAKSYTDITNRQKRTLSTIGQLWNIDEFKHEREPIPIHKVEDRLAFQNPMPNVVNLPIKMVGDDEVYLPSEYEGIVEALSKITAYEKDINPSYNDYYAYLTIDNTFVKEGQSQSRFVYHVDGFQTAEQTTTTVQRNYVVTDIVPNDYVLNPMEIKGLCGEKLSVWFDSFTHQAQHVEKMRSIPLTIYLYDSYQVHSPTLSMATTDKTTLRVSYTKRQLNTIGNGLNPLIPYEWTYIPNSLEAEVT